LHQCTSVPVVLYRYRCSSRYAFDRLVIYQIDQSSYDRASVFLLGMDTYNIRWFISISPLLFRSFFSGASVEITHSVQALSCTGLSLRVPVLFFTGYCLPSFIHVILLASACPLHLTGLYGFLDKSGFVPIRFLKDRIGCAPIIISAYSWL